MKIVVCIGSSCHLKGSRDVVARLQELIVAKGVGGTFCVGECQKGVCVKIDEEFFSVTPDTVDEFFDTEVLTKLG